MIQKYELFRNDGVLDEKAAIELDEKRKISDDWMNKLIDKPEVKEFLMDKLKEMMLEQ